MMMMGNLAEYTHTYTYIVGFERREKVLYEEKKSKLVLFLCDILKCL